MSLAEANTTETGLQRALAQVLAAAEAILAEAKSSVHALVARDGKIDAGAMETHQRATHGLAWLATYVFSLRELESYTRRMSAQGRFGEMEDLLVRIAAGEYAQQIVGGMPMNQGEIVRCTDLGLSADFAASRMDTANAWLLENGNMPENRARLVALIRDIGSASAYGDPGLDETMEAIREEMRRFGEAEVTPHAHDWHLANAYIPMEIIEKMSELGVFGLTIPEEFGGMGLGKESMCVVSEELSRAYIGVGSLGTRSEIAAELILGGGTDAQKAHWLPKIASGEIIPTAVFTEPNIGSDLASLKTRAARDGDTYAITGQKTWITHPVRADLMTVMARTNPDEKGYRGLSMFLAEKPRGSDETPFPADGMTGGEIEVLGYRGMKEYDISFDGFQVPAANLLGETEGQSFKQLMQTLDRKSVV